MLKVQDLLHEINRNLLEEVGSIYKYNDFILVGNNMSGKSWLIKELLKSNQDKIYFIDSINRTIATNNPIGKFEDINDKKEILLQRIKDENFNTRDTVAASYNNSLILNELYENIEVYKDNINYYFETSFEVILESEVGVNQLFSENIYKYRVGSNIYDKLSNGFQAIIRILVEITFAISQGAEVIIIDEIDLHLDSENCKRIIKYLRDRFTNTKLIFTTHSPDVISGSEKFNIFKIESDNCSYFDGDDLNDIPYINRILFEPNILVSNPIDNELSSFLKLKVAGRNLNEEELNRLNSYDNLTVKQKILRDYINRWDNED